MIINSIDEFNEQKVEQAIKNNEKIIFSNKTIVLASASNPRKEIMRDSNLQFVVIKNTLDEESVKCYIKAYEDAETYVKELSYKKAMTIAPLVENAVIIAADTIAYCDGEKLEKPKDRADAYRILTKLSGSTHHVLTGVCIVQDGNVDNFAVSSEITMKKIDDDKLEELLNNKNTYLYAGGYNIDDNINGYAIFRDEDFNNIKGLPIEEILPKINIK